MVLERLDFDGQTMTIPARNILNSFSARQLCPTDYIFQDFIECMSGVKSAIGIWRSIMQNKGVILNRSMASLPRVEVIGASLEIFRLVCKCCTWWER